MTTDILDFDAGSATSTATANTAPASTASTSTPASAPEAATVASGSPASDPTPAQAAPSASFTSDDFDVMESQLDLRDPKPKSAEPAVASTAAATANDAASAATTHSDPSTGAKSESTAAAPEGPFTQSQLDLASHYGFTADEVKSFGTPDALQKVLTAMDRRELSAAKSQSQPDATAEDRPAEKQGDAPAATEDQLRALGIEKLDLDLSGWDDEAASMFRKIDDHFHAQLAKVVAAKLPPQDAAPEVVALREEIESLKAHSRQAEGERFERDLDSYFSGLGQEYHDKFGTAPMRALAKDSPHAVARQELIQEFVALQSVDNRLQRPAMPLQQVLNRALAAKYADQVTELARKQVRAEVEQRRAQAVERPTQRTVPVETGEEAASSWVNQFYRERGYDTDGSLREALAEIE
jgi:hypothetical protein